MMPQRSLWRVGLLGLALAASGVVPTTGRAQDAPTPRRPATSPVPPTPTEPGGPSPADFPPYEKVIEGYEKVVSTADGQPSLYTLWVRKRDGQMLAELPRDYASQRIFLAMTVASGEIFAGLQAGDLYAYWRPYDKRLALIAPNIETRSNGDNESKASVKRLFTDRVVLDLPILTMVPRGGPVIDLDELLVSNATKFFGGGRRMSGGGPQGFNPKLSTIKTAKAFPKNLEIGVEVPNAGGILQTLHYSISLIPDSTGYSPRAADERVGYFTTAYSDLGKYKDRETRVRYINRWHLEKADPSLEVSPPKSPIVFYIEHTTPVRYRRWVREGLLYWNKAFEKVGFSNAIEVYYQDAATGAHMDKDPEDVRYNFLRWLNNNVGTAIGPSRVHPLTGQILDADIVLTDGWIRHFWKQFNEVMPEVAVEGFNAETLTWLDEHPRWDPRIRLAPPAERGRILADRARDTARRYGGHPLGRANTDALGDDEMDGLVGRLSQVNGLCLASTGKAMDVALMHMHLAAADGGDLGALADGDDKDGDKQKGGSAKSDAKKPRMIDGMPEAFIGPMLADLVAHEVGHTLGLRHNFKASGLYTLAEINSPAVKGKKPLAGSVMDYMAANINVKSGEVQGDFTMIGVGPYDEWAIEYGYGSGDLKAVLARVAEPELQYATDEDTGGPDPLARRYDFSKNPLDHARNQMRLAEYHRGRLIDKFVQDGESWAKARAGYELTLGMQTQALSTMANWVGGASVHRDRKGDKNARRPVEVIPCATQREALTFVIDHAFRDEAFGLTPEILARLTVDKWLDGDGARSAMNNEPTWPVHDRIMGIQASALTMLMNPTTLRRVFDNEVRIPADQDALTLPELMETVGKAVWKELDAKPEAAFTARRPMISSLRRNLQREHMERLVDLTLPSAGFTAAEKPIANLASLELRKLAERIAKALEASSGKADPYSVAHLTETRERILKALDAQYIYNARDLQGGGGPTIFLMGEDPAPARPADPARR